ncbi:hypothetical protein Tco_1569190 [Tanacetum coccineum]
MNNSVTIAYRFKITLQLCFFDGSKPKNNDELHPRLSNFFKNIDSNGGDDLCYQVAKIKVIKEGFEKLRLLEINDDLFACNTPLGTIFNEFNRLSRMDDDLFTYEVEIPRLSSISCYKKEGDDLDDGDLGVYEPRVCYDENDGIYIKAVIFVTKRLVKEGIISKWLVRSYKKQFDEYMEIKKQWMTRGIDADMEYESSDVKFAEWLASKFYNHKTMDQYTKNALWIYWTRGDDENLIDKDEVAEIFRIETDIFDFKTPICKAFNEFNYLIKIDIDLLTTWVPEKPWSKNGIPIDDIHHICELIRFKNGKAKWPTCNSNDEGFYNGGELPGMVQVGYMTYFQDHEWYDDLVDGKLKKEALKQKTIYEKSWGDATHGVMSFCANDEEDIHEEREPNDDRGIDNLDNHLVWDNASYHANDEEYEEDTCELLGNPFQESPVFKIRRFEIIKYSFGPIEKYIAIKECEYDDLTRTEYDACHAYQEIFCIMDKVMLASNPTFTTHNLSLERNVEDHTEQIPGEFLVLILLVSRYGVSVPALHKKPRIIEDVYAVSRSFNRRQVETELKLEEKFRELCEEESTIVKEREDVVEELERLSGKHVAKETSRLLRRGQKRDLDKMTHLQIMEVSLATKQVSLAPRVIKMQENEAQKLQVVALSLSLAWPLELSKAEFVCSSYAQNGEGDLEASMIDLFALEMLPELDLDAKFFVLV